MPLGYFSRIPALLSARHITLIHKLKSKATHDFVDVFLMLFILREETNRTRDDGPECHGAIVVSPCPAIHSVSIDNRTRNRHWDMGL